MNKNSQNLKNSQTQKETKVDEAIDAGDDKKQSPINKESVLAQLGEEIAKVIKVREFEPKKYPYSSTEPKYAPDGELGKNINELSPEDRYRNIQCNFTLFYFYIFSLFYFSLLYNILILF